MITVIYDHDQSTSRLADVPANQSLEEIMMDEEVNKISKQNFKEKLDFVDSSRVVNEESTISVR